jgi:hypothetical protein
MKKLVSFLICGFIIMWSGVELHGQGNGTFEEIKVTYVLRSDMSGFSALESRVGDRGMTPEEFGAWLTDNTAIHVQTDGRFDPGPAFPLGSARIMVFAVNERGIVDQNSMSVQISDQETLLGRTVNGSQMGRFIKNTSQSFPTRWHPTPDNWYPRQSELSPIESSRDLQRLASDIGRRVIGSGGGAGSGKVSIIVMTAPDTDRYEVPVVPGVAVFAFDVKD